MTATLAVSALKLESSPSVTPFVDFLEVLRDKMHHVFHVRGDIDTFSLERGLPPFALREIMSAHPLSVSIPKEFGGRGGKVHETLAVLSAAAYESLALSLTFGINSALFLQPVAKYAQDKIKAPIFDRFLEEQAMGGLMITEPDYGTDALSMQTAYTEQDEHYHVQGVKHWGGLTGWADYWLVTAREATPERGLKRDIGFFICDSNASGQQIEVAERYHNLGLYMIPYGRNHVDIRVPKVQRLEPHSTGIKMMLDLLHRSRMQFPGIAVGFAKRMVDEALSHCKERFVGGKPLLELDQVKARLARLQAGFTVCSAMCAYSSEHAGPDNDLSGWGLEANILKTVVTDLMHEASQSLLQLVGAKGYRLDHIAGRSTVDSRPYQIFEGSNDVLYSQISETILKRMRSDKEDNLHRFLSRFPLTSKTAERFKSDLDFTVDLQLPQRKLVELGRILSRVVSMELVEELGEKGFKAELVSNALKSLQQEVTGLLSTYQVKQRPTVVDHDRNGSDWLEFV